MGSVEKEQLGRARLVAMTELFVPPSGFSSPHRLAIVENENGVRALAIVDGEVTAIDQKGRLARDGAGRLHWEGLSP